MAVDFYLELEGIKGEAQDKTHKDKIDVLSWSWGASQSGTTHMGSGSGSGKAHFQDLSITKFVDKSTPVLLQHVSTGKHITKGTLFVRKAAGDNPLEYIKLEMKDIIVTNVSTGGSGSDDRITESVTLNFGEYKYIYTEQKPDGSKGAAPEFAWDIAANEKKVRLRPAGLPRFGAAAFFGLDRRCRLSTFEAAPPRSYLGISGAAVSVGLADG